METSLIRSLLVLMASFISSFAGIAAGIIMVTVTKKFGQGILSYGFNAIAIGIIVIVAGIITDSFANYLLVLKNHTLNTLLLILKESLFVIGAYIIVIGSKRTADKLEKLTKH